MATETPTPTPTATPPAAFDPAAFAQQMAAQFGEQLKAAFAPLGERLEKLERPPEPAAAAGKGDGKDKPLTLADVDRLVAEKLGQAQQQTAAQRDRERFQGEKLKDLPEVYRDKLGADPTKWPAEEQALRERWKADLAPLGLKVPVVLGVPPHAAAAAVPPAAAVNLAGRTAEQNIADGIREMEKARG